MATTGLNLVKRMEHDSLGPITSGDSGTDS
jgi:hypothetical protein